MKNFFIIVCLFGQIIASENAYAGGGLTGGSTELTQMMNNIELLAVAGSGSVTAISTAGTLLNEQVLKPIQTGLISVAQQQMGQTMIDLGNGGFDGQPLIVDPSKALETAKLTGVKKGLAGLSSNSAYGDSIFSSLVSQYKDSGDLTAKISSLSSSEVPSLVQKNMCSDAGLNTLAVQDVGENDQAAVNARKKELYDYVCKKDPKTDIVTAKRLTDLAEQRPTLGGWDKWLAVTGGDNAFTASQKVAVEVAQKAAEDKELKSKELFEGLGAVSQTKCTKYADLVSQDPVCLESVVLTPGKVITGSVTKGATAALDRLTSLQAGGLMSLLTNFAVSKLTSGITSQFGGGNTSGNNTSITITSKAPAKQDLKGDPERKKETIRFQLLQLSTYSDMLSKLELIDSPYLADVNAYQSKVTAGKTCYDQLLADNIISSNHPAFGIYSSRQLKINTIKNIIVPELTKIGEARTYITETTSKLEASESTEEIGAIFNTYIATVEDRKYPKMESVSIREGDYRGNQTIVKNDTEINTTNANCTQIRGSQSNSNYQP